ncbi:hypothetical protein RJ640_024983 [Escallonia rubra]|uniref:DUF668 domain-containing protein n=1 Tax=Escallonia rubra TaxID=112253 RepID=A0AA88UD24_9ASTE|nr:hypothetical protein RJ640_024983 [Escallonia rubra]
MYLNSKDVAFILSLVCAERLEDINRAATAVAQLGRKCSDSGLNRFDLVYTDLKLEDDDYRENGAGKNNRASVRTKLKKKVSVMEDDESLEAGWREALTEMMGWLAPMNLHFADKEKTEAAIARMRSLLVGI